MKLHSLQRYSYLLWLLLALITLGSVKATEEHKHSESREESDNAPDMLAGDNQNLNTTTGSSTQLVPLNSSREELLSTNDEQDKNVIQQIIKLQKIFQQIAQRAPDKEDRGNILLRISYTKEELSRQKGISKQIAWLRKIAPITSKPDLNMPLTIALTGNVIAESNKIENKHLKDLFKLASQKTREEIVFGFLFTKEDHDLMLSFNNIAFSDNYEKLWGQMIFKMGAYYFNEKTDSCKNELLYAFFCPYNIKYSDEIQNIWREQLTKIEARIKEDGVYKAFLEALAHQHTLFMYGFITPRLWENDPIRRYVPKLWYMYSMIGAKLYSLWPKNSHNYQGLYLWLGVETNDYTKVIEAQRKALNAILYPSDTYTIWHMIRIVLMGLMIFDIIWLFTKLKEQRDNYTLAPGIDPKKIRSRVRGDLRSVLLDLFRDVPWLQPLQPYAYADTPGTINEIGRSFVILLFFFSCSIFIPKSKQQQQV